MRAAGRGPLAKFSTAFARTQQRLPLRVDILELSAWRGEVCHEPVGIGYGGEHSALVAIRIGVVAEAGMPERITVIPVAMFAIAFFQEHHKSLKVPFPDACEDRADPGARRREN